MDFATREIVPKYSVSRNTTNDSLHYQSWYEYTMTSIIIHSQEVFTPKRPPPSSPCASRPQLIAVAIDIVCIHAQSGSKLSLDGVLLISAWLDLPRMIVVVITLV